MPRDQGFTIIEVLCVVAIIGLLAAVAIPQYQGYAMRSKHAEALLAAASCRVSVSEYLQSASSQPPADWGCAGSSAPTKYVASVEVDQDGKITVATRELPNREDGSTGGRITFAPLGPDGNVAQPGQRVASWRCGARQDGTDVAPSMLPRTCSQ